MFEGLLQPTHLILVLVVALFVLGPKRLPEAGRSLGSGLRGFKDAIAGNDRDDAVPPVLAPVATLEVAEPVPAAPHAVSGE